MCSCFYFKRKKIMTLNGATLFVSQNSFYNKEELLDILSLLLVK